MPLIKHNHAEQALRHATVLDLGDLRRAAEDALRAARDEASRIEAEAKAEARRLVESASEAGRAEGFERGRLDGLASVRDELLAELGPRLEALAGSWTEALERWEKDRRELLRAGTEDVLAFAVALGEKVVHRVIEADPTVVRAQMAEALALVNRPGSIEVCINPLDRPEVDRMLPAVMQEIAGCGHVGVREDASVTRGGCVVRTQGGSIDARIETQLERIAETLLPRDGGAPGGDAPDAQVDGIDREGDAGPAPDEQGG